LIDLAAANGSRRGEKLLHGQADNVISQAWSYHGFHKVDFHMAQLDEVDRIIARSNWPTPRPSTMFRILALVTSDIAAGRPFPRQIEIARRMQRHESLVRTNLRLLGKLEYIVEEGRRWRLHEGLPNWTATDETYAEMMSRYFNLRRRWQSFR
jgi:hypothetical protein